MFLEHQSWLTAPARLEHGSRLSDAPLSGSQEITRVWEGSPGPGWCRRAGPRQAGVEEAMGQGRLLGRAAASQGLS